MYTASVKVNPSKDASVCTYKQQFSSEFYKAKRDKCKLVVDKSVCFIDSDCEWTPLYGRKFEKGDCVE